MGRVNIRGLRGLSAKDRDYAEQEYLRTIQGWNTLTDDEKDAFYRDDNFRISMLDRGLSPQLRMENFINLKDNYTPEYYRETLTNYLLGNRPSDPIAQDRRPWYDKLFGIGDDGTNEFSYRMQLAELQDWDNKQAQLKGLTNEQLQQRVLEQLANERANFNDAQRKQEEAQRKERDEKLQYYRGLSGGERDRIYADQMFENAFKGTKDWELLKTLHPSVRDEIYNNERYFTESPNGDIRDANDDYRTWYEKAASGITQGLRDAALVFTPEYAEGTAPGLLGFADYLRGGEKGAVIGSIYGAATGSLWNTWIQRSIGGYGPSNIPYTFLKHDKETILDELHAKSNLLIKSEIGDEVGALVEWSLLGKETDPNWKLNLDKSWEELTSSNPLLQSFKDSSYALLSDGQKVRLICQTKAINDKYDLDTAMQILNDDINDIISVKLGASFLRSNEGAMLKFAASKGEKLVWLSNKVGITDLMGIDDAQVWSAMKYLDNVDKLGLLSREDLEDVVYGTNTLAYKNFVTLYMAENGGTEETARQAWIEEQESTGDYKGSGISPNKRVRAVGLQHNWFSIDGALDAYEMSGYIADQATSQWVTGKITKGLGKPIGAQSRKINDYILKSIRASPEKRLAILGALNSWFTKAGGYARAYYGAVPISVGYGMAAYDEVRQKGLEQIIGLINKEIDESPEYTAQVQAIYDKYGLIDASEGNAANAAQLREQMMSELNTLRQNWIERKKEEKAEDFAKLREEADDAYNMNFMLESLRNTSINLSYKTWLYKDASRAVHGGRIPLDLPNFEKTLGKIGFSDTGKRIDQRILSTNFGKKFGQYVQDEEGNLVRNTSKWRKTAESANQVRKNIWGGFWSNYMDDVSVGFSAGFNLYDFNDYMQAKYNPETYGETSDLMSSFIAGAESGAERMLDEQSFTDGFIGAMGSLVSFNPAGSLKLLTGWKNFTHDANGNRLSKIQIANQFLGNPILGTIGMVQEERAATDARLERLNKMIADDGVNINDTLQLLHWAAARKDNHDFGDFLDMKDANDGLGFAILYNLAKLEEEGGHYGEVAKGYFEDLERLAKGGENITNEDINAFLGNPENRHLLDEHVHTNEDGEVVQMDDEGKKLYALMQLQSNAQKLLDMNKKLRKNLGNVKKAFQNYNINDDAAVQLAYSLTMQGQWEDRLKTLNKKVANSQDYSTESNEDVEYRSRTFTEKRLALIDAKIKETEKQIAQHQANVDQLEGVSRGRALKEAANTEGSLRDKDNAYKRQRAALLSLSERLIGDEQLEASKQALKGRKKELARLKDVRKHVAAMLKERDKTPNTVTDVEEYMYQDPAIHDVETLDKHLIMALNPQQRANMILAPETYSKAQQEVVKELIAEEEQKNPDFKTDIRDAAILYNRLQQNKQTIDNIMADRENFNRYAQTVAMKNLMYNSLRYYNSDEYKALVDNSQKRKEFVAQMPATDDNQRNIINSVVDYLLNVAAKGRELDLTNTAEVMQLFDENRDAILKALNDSKTATLETPNGTIDMLVSNENNMSVRDLLQRAIEANAENQRVIEERQQEVSVPKPEVTAQPETVAPVEEGKPAKSAEELETKTEYKVAQKATDEGKLGVDAIVKYLNGEPVSPIQLSFLDPLGEEGQREGEEDAEYAKRLAQKYIDAGYIEVSETAPETPTAPATPTTTGRYQVNPDVVIDRDTANKELGRTYSNLNEIVDVNATEQLRLQHTADYLNGQMSISEYIDKMGYVAPSNQEAAFLMAEEIAGKYKKYLKDTLEGSGRPTRPSTEEQPAETHLEAVDEILDIIDNIFIDAEGVSSSTVEFSNPSMWSDKYSYTEEVKKLWANLFGPEGITAATRILREEAEKEAKDRKKVYFVVPKAWEESYRKASKEYLPSRDMPIVAVVEDPNGGLPMMLNGKETRFTPIGLAPATSLVHDYSKVKNGQFRMEALRNAAIKEGVVQTNLLITDSSGNPIKSNLLRIDKITPPSMKKGIFKTIADIALQKLGFNDTTIKTKEKPKIEDIFLGKETGKETSLYTSFRDNFLSKLKIKKNPKTEDNGLFYEYPYEGSTRNILIFIVPLAETNIELPEELAIDGKRVISLFECLQRSDATLNNFLLEKSETRGSAMLKILADRIQYELDRALHSEVLTDSSGNLLIAEELSEGLTSAFDNIFYNANNGTNFKIKVADQVVNEEVEGQEVPHMQISLDYGEGSAELIKLPINAERLDNNTMIDIIRRFLFDGINGTGEFRGKNQISKLNWNRHYKDLWNYEGSLNNLETTKDKAIVRISRALFDDGILSVSLVGIPDVTPYIAAPFDTTGRPVISSEVSNSDNAGNLEGNTGHAENATITNNRSVTDVLKDNINTTIDKILKYSRQQREVIKQRREAAKEAKQTAKNHLSATTIAGIMYDSNFSEDSPYYYPSTMIGTDVDTFVRDFFETDDKGSFLFDKNSIDYSKYPTLSEEVLNEMVEGLNILKQQMLDRGETRIISEEVITDGTIKVKLQDGRTIEVPNTGHLDMMTIDNMGKIHIYDMKTFRNDDAFLEKIFKDYAAQLNVYKNLLEKQYGVKVDSVQIIPITVDYPAPSESNVYSERDGQLLLNDEVLQLDNPNTTRMGMAINVDALVKDAASKVRDEASVQAEAMLKAIGFTQEEIERLKRGDTDTILEKKKKMSSYTVSLNIPMTTEVTLDMDNLTEGQRAKVNAIIEQLQKENGEQNPSQVASMKVEAAPATGIVINSDLLTDTKNPVPDAASAFVGREIIDTEGQTITEKKEEIDDTASCHTTAAPKSRLTSRGRGRNIRF